MGDWSKNLNCQRPGHTAVHTVGLAQGEGLVLYNEASDDGSDSDSGIDLGSGAVWEQILYARNRGRIATGLH